MNIRRWGTVFLPAIALLATMIELWSLGREIEIVVDGERRRIETQTHNAQERLRLNDLAEILSLQLRERGSSLTIVGVRGEILITDGRPLVRSGDHYVLLSSGVWRRSEGDWYVPEDFLVRALANIISQKVERRTDGSFHLKRLRTNQIRVVMNSYPDHLSVIFEASQKAPVQVREFRDYIEVAFSDFLVRPEEVESSPDPRLVTAVEFNEQESLGSFRIRKGSQYLSFRKHYLESPVQLILEVYGTSATRASESVPTAVPSLGTQPTGSNPEEVAVRPSTSIRDVVIIDPGHGGIDYGVDAYQDLLEKVITLNIARQIERELIKRGVKVRLTRTRDLQLPNEQRSAISNFYQCRLYIGIHLGGAPADSTRGPVVYIYSLPGDAGAASGRASGEGERELVQWNEGQAKFAGPSRRLANSVQRELNQLFEAETPVVAARLAVLAPVKAPAVLVETGFLTNTDDQGLLAAPGFQDKIADGITNAIIQFLR